MLYSTNIDQERVIQFVLRASKGKRWGNPIPPSIENQTYRVEVEMFTKKILQGKPYYIPQGLQFLGKPTWEKLIKEYNQGA